MPGVILVLQCRRRGPGPRPTHCALCAAGAPFGELSYRGRGHAGVDGAAPRAVSDLRRSRGRWERSPDCPQFQPQRPQVRWQETFVLPQTGAAAEPPALQRERPRTGNKVSIASLLRFTKPSHLQQKQLTFGLVSQCVSHFFASSCAGDANADLPAGGPRVGAAGGPAREGQGALGAVSTPRVQHPHPGCPRALENRMAAFATLPAGAHQHQPQPSSSQRAMSPGSGAERHPHKSSPRRQEGEGEPAWPHIYSRDSCVSAGGGGHRMTQVEAWGPVLLEGQ